MSEPVYEFVKGKGWILQPPGVIFVHKNSNKQYTAFARKPSVGEIATFCAVNEPPYTNGDTVNLEAFISWFQTKMCLDTFYSETEEDFARRVWGDRPIVWVTVVPYE